MSIRNVSFAPIAAETHGGAGNGNTYRFRIDREIECGPRGSNVWVASPVLAACERDVASDFEGAGQPVPPELAGPYDGYGRPARAKVQA